MASSLSNLVNKLSEVVTKFVNESFMESSKKDFLMHTNFLTKITISLFYYYEKVFIFTNIWMIWKKEDFYSHLNMEDITDADYVRAKRVCKDFEIKYLGEYYDLYVQNDT